MSLPSSPSTRSRRNRRARSSGYQGSIRDQVSSPEIESSDDEVTLNLPESVNEYFRQDLFDVTISDSEVDEPTANLSVQSATSDEEPLDSMASKSGVTLPPFTGYEKGQSYTGAKGQETELSSIQEWIELIEMAGVAGN